MATPAPIDVALCFDDNFALPAAVTILSLLDTNCGPVRLHIFTDPNTRAAPLLCAIADRYEISLFIHDDAPESRHDLDPASDYGRESTATYRRIFIPERLLDLDRILYIDADILVRGSLSELWNTNLGEAPLAAVPDAWMASLAGARDEFPDGYFNAGLLLIDLERWRRERLTERTLQAIRARQERAAAAGLDALAYRNDQTPLNDALRGRWQPLSPRWNFTTFHTPRAGALLGLEPALFDPIAADPSLVHFLGAYKPWLAGFESLTGWHREYHALQIRLEQEFDLGRLGWPRPFTNGDAAIGARRMMALRLVHKARNMGFDNPAIVLTGLLGRDVLIVAREQGLPIACLVSENPALAGGRLHGETIMAIGDAITRGYRQLSWEIIVGRM